MDSQNEDIQEALSSVEAAGHSGEGGSGSPSDVKGGGAAALAMPDKKYLFGSLWWGIRSAVSKSWMAARAHPWWSALGFGTAIACGQFACIYMGFTVLAGLMILGLNHSCRHGDKH